MFSFSFRGNCTSVKLSSVPRLVVLGCWYAGGKFKALEVANREGSL
jgi:hypothetical protein